MTAQDRLHRSLAALATYCLLVAASFIVMLQVCTRCGTDNAYLGEVLLGLLLGFMGVVFGLTWWVATKKGEAIRGLGAGGVSGAAAGIIVIVIGATRTLVPPALSAIELVIIAAGLVSTVLLARVER